MSGKWLALATGAVAAAAAVGAYAVATYEEERACEMRAALDIGSGSMKLVVAKVNTKTNKVVQIRAAEYVELLLAHDLKQSTDNKLSDAVLYQAIAVLRSLLAICRRERVARNKIYAVSTQVFRIAANGPEFLQRVQSELGLAINLITQDQEAFLGFLTGFTLSRVASASDIVVYDSGGASFQLTAWPPGAHAVETYTGALGSTPVTVALIESIQKKSFRATQSPNPVHRDEVLALRGWILDTLINKPPSAAIMAAVARAGGLLVGIGEATCIFSIAAIAIGRNEYTSEEVWNAVFATLDRTDEELARFPQPTMVVPKLVLLYTVMTHVAARRVRYEKSTGLCNGVLVHPPFYA